MSRVLRAQDVGKVLLKGGPARVNEPVSPRFRPGDRVLTRTINPAGHTRLPRYARGRRGVVDRDWGVFIFPDSSAAGRGAKAQHLYSVRFDARELWGPAASARAAIYLDLWDDYLDPVEVGGSGAAPPDTPHRDAARPIRSRARTGSDAAPPDAPHR